MRLKLTAKTLRGFTFVELSLAILFVSLLALTVAMVTTNISQIYSKGLVIKAINSTGSDLIEELITGIQSAPATQLSPICDTVFGFDTTEQKLCIADQSYKFIFSEYKGTVKVVDTDDTRPSSQLSGVFCTGKYSYLWNTGYINNSLYSNLAGATIPPASMTYRVSGAAGIKNTDDVFPNGFRLLRFEDPSRVACASQLDGYGSGTIGNKYSSIPSATYDLTHESTGAPYYLPSDPVDLLPPTENPLSLYGFYVAPPSQDSVTNRLFYSGSFILATLRGGVDITATHDYCEIRDGFSDDIDYCAVNKFNFAAQASGK